MKAYRTYIVAPLVDENPITLQMLGICSALAVTTNMATALTMSLAVTVVLVVSAGVISLIRSHIPSSVRLIIQITIIASLVIVIDLVLQAYFFDISQRLSIFVGLIVTNCLVLGRAESFSMRNPVGVSMLDGLGNGLGYSLVLLIVAFIRELFGFGTLFGNTVWTSVDDGGWFQPLALMQSAPSAFFIIGLLVWLVRCRKTVQVEKTEFQIIHATKFSELHSND